MQSTPKRAFFYIGTEAEFIKLHPVIEMCIRKGLDILLICNGQNNLRDSVLMTERMSIRSVFLLKGPIWFPFTNFSSRAIWLGFWGMLTFLNTFRFLMASRKNRNHRPVFIVHGDTLSTLIGSFVARLLGYQIIHVESGLTSGFLLNPFPEEICRRIVIRLADVRLCPTLEAFKHVRDYPGKRKLLTNGNTMWDMLQYGLKSEYANKFPQYFLLIIHRQETLANPDLFFEIIEMIKLHKPVDLKCVFVLHKPTHNFLVSYGKIEELTVDTSWILVERQPFLKFAHMLKNARFVLTDGGSNQEECYYLGLPCYLLRECTERIEGLGHNVVLRPDFVQDIPWFMQNYELFRREPVIFNQSPSDIIAEEITLECLGKYGSHST
jgi:UDP-N-acetylglucosamine 2-epimerase (non-hydrolysing)